MRSADELRAIVDEAEGAGIIPRAQEEMLYNVFDFARREARSVMVPALDVHWVEAEHSPAEALDALLATPHSRAPVGRGSVDRIVGMVHVRELAAAVRAGKPARVADIARPAPVVPETKDLGALLRELREDHQPVAIVADEYGGTAGLVTVEDIVEEIVGDIDDEFDLPDGRIERVDAHRVRVAGSMSVDDLCEELALELDAGRAHTLAGLVFDQLGRRPVAGDRIELGGVAFQVLELDGLRITRLELTLPTASVDG